VNCGANQLGAYTIEELTSSIRFFDVREKAPEFVNTFRALSVLACKAERAEESESDTSSDSSSRPTSSYSSSSSSTKPGINSGYEDSDPMIMSDISTNSDESGLYSGLSAVSNISITSKAEPEVQHLKTVFLEDSLECLQDLFFLSKWQGLGIRIDL
jgi:hypothetical protein